MKRGGRLVASAIAVFVVFGALVFHGIRPAPRHYHFAEDHGRFICSTNGGGADVRVVDGRTYVHPTGWRCDYAEWQRTGRINVEDTR